MQELAIEKLKKEEQSFKGGNKEKAVYHHVVKALIDFCKQDQEFAQAIYQNDKTLSDCCKEIMKNVGSSVSDIEVYRRAVQFYFKGATIEMQMKIDLCGEVRHAAEPMRQKETPIVLNLMDFL